MTPFHRAREVAWELRRKLFKEATATALTSKVIVDAVASEDAEDFQISDALPTDKALGGADAVLVRKFHQIIVRNDVSSAERAFLVAHEFGHWMLHYEGHEGCHKVVEATLKPEESDTFGAQKVEAYGARCQRRLKTDPLRVENVGVNLTHLASYCINS